MTKTSLFAAFEGPFKCSASVDCEIKINCRNIDILGSQYAEIVERSLDYVPHQQLAFQVVTKDSWSLRSGISIRNNPTTPRGEVEYLNVIQESFGHQQNYWWDILCH